MMIRSRLPRLSVFAAGVTLALAAAVPFAAAQEQASPAFGKLINSAKAEASRGSFAAAQKDVSAASALATNSYEQFIVEQMRGYLAAQGQDYPAAINAFTAEINSGRLSPGDALSLTDAIAGYEFTLKNYSQASQWIDRYYHRGGTDPALKEVQIQAHYLSNDYATAIKLQQNQINAEIKAGKTPSKDEFNLIYSCDLALKDTDGVMALLREAVIYYPDQVWWTTLINNVINADNFDTDRLEYDAGLLQVATKAISSTDDYMTLIQTALQQDHSGMAKKLFDQATTAGTLGSGTPADVNRQQRLYALIKKTISDDTAAEKSDLALANTDGDQAATLGYNLIDLGSADQGIALLEKSLGMNLTMPNIVRLRLGEAYAEVGRTADAINMFNTVQGDTGTAALAQLWIVHLKQKS